MSESNNEQICGLSASPSSDTSATLTVNAEHIGEPPITEFPTGFLQAQIDNPELEGFVDILCFDGTFDCSPLNSPESQAALAAALRPAASIESQVALAKALRPSAIVQEHGTKVANKCNGYRVSGIKALCSSLRTYLSGAPKWWLRFRQSRTYPRSK